MKNIITVLLSFLLVVGCVPKKDEVKNDSGSNNESKQSSSNEFIQRDSFYLSYKNDRPNYKIYQVAIPLPEIDDINDKLKYLAGTFELSSILVDSLYANDKIDELIRKNEESIRDLGEQIKGKTQAEQEAMLEQKLTELEVTPDFLMAKQDVDDKYKELKKRTAKLGMDALKDMILRKLTKDNLYNNSSVMTMSFFEKAKALNQLRQVEQILKQIEFTTKAIALISKRSTENIKYVGQDIFMYVRNTLQNHLADDLSESEAIDQEKAWLFDADADVLVQKTWYQPQQYLLAEVSVNRLNDSEFARIEPGRYIQVAAFNNLFYAKKFKNELDHEEIESLHIFKRVGERYYKIVAGPVFSNEDVDYEKTLFNDLGYENLVVVRLGAPKAMHNK
ncbi:MAG: SPOR domain-containing protein [Methylococcales bacterium]|nr:SPOR domain-containing protein [Methylococcales bacterium]